MAAANANVNYPILNNDPLANMKVEMARALRDVVGLDQTSGQCQYFLRYAGPSLHYHRNSTVSTDETLFYSSSESTSSST